MYKVLGTFTERPKLMWIRRFVLPFPIGKPTLVPDLVLVLGLAIIGCSTLGYGPGNQYDHRHDRIGQSQIAQQ